MGEDRQDAHSTPPGRKFTVSEAAEVLGISAEAVRSRIKRGTLESIKEGAHVYVLLDTDQTTDQARPDRDQTRARSQSDSTTLISRLEDEVRFLREELARKDAILLRMAESVPQIEAPRDERERPPEATEDVSGAPPPPERETTTSRPWWRRMLGG